MNTKNENRRVMVVTGASSGLGEACTLYFADQGWSVCALARNQEKLAKIAEQKPENIFVYATDVSKAPQVKKTFDAIAKDHGIVDVLINNAGFTGSSGPAFVGEAAIDASDDVIDTNLKGAMYCVYSVAPGMMERKNGQIINISSIAGIPGAGRSFFDSPEGKVPMSAYGISKNGMTSMEESLGNNLLKCGVRMTTLCPGGIETPLWVRDGTRRYPLPEAELMAPEELVDLIDFLLRQPRHTIYKQIVMFPTCEWT